MAFKSIFTDRWQTITNFFGTQKLPGSEIGTIFTSEFWTNDQYRGRSAYLAINVFLVAVSIIGLLFWRQRLYQQHRQTPIFEWLINQLTNLIIFILVISVSYIFFWVQGIQYLSSRLVILAALIVVIVWLGLIIYHHWRAIPFARQRHLEKERFFRYLPHKKEKK